jgi:hypothetical protein
MPKSSYAPYELVKENTADRLVLSFPHWLKPVGKVIAIIALASGLGMIIGNVELVGIAIALLCAGLGVWLAQSHFSVIFDVLQCQVLFSTRYLLFEKRVVIPFKEISTVYLDYQERTVNRAMAGDYTSEKWIKRKWTIFLAFTSGKTATVVSKTSEHPAGQISVLSTQLAFWEDLAAGICILISKLLVRTPSVPGFPHTFIEAIEQIVQHLLAQSQMGNRSVHLRQHIDGGLEIEVDGSIHRNLSEIDDITIQELIQAAIDEWQNATRFNGNQQSSDDSHRMVGSHGQWVG